MLPTVLASRSTGFPRRRIPIARASQCARFPLLGIPNAQREYVGTAQFRRKNAALARIVRRVSWTGTPELAGIMGFGLYFGHR